jgi:hypothetical protein
MVAVFRLMLVGFELICIRTQILIDFHPNLQFHLFGGLAQF